MEVLKSEIEKGFGAVVVELRLLREEGKEKIPNDIAAEMLRTQQKIYGSVIKAQCVALVILVAAVAKFQLSMSELTNVVANAVSSDVAAEASK